VKESSEFWIKRNGTNLPNSHLGLLGRVVLNSPIMIEPVSLSPIGYVKCCIRNKFYARRQPVEDGSNELETTQIELLPHQNFEVALSDLSGFSKIWVIFLFHKNKSWRPKVTPPRGAGAKVGVFATRSPHRPNPIGISALELLSIDGLTLTIGACDLLDGTPILDIKPYIPSCDAFPEAEVGWLKEIERDYSGPRPYNVVLSELAKTQAAWLAEREINFLDKACLMLERDPSVHRTRRIKKHGENLYRMGCAEWRVFFSLEEKTVEIQHLASGFPITRLEAPGHEVIPNRDAQLEFQKLWPQNWS